MKKTFNNRVIFFLIAFFEAKSLIANPSEITLILKQADEQQQKAAKLLAQQKDLFSEEIKLKLDEAQGKPIDPTEKATLEERRKQEEAKNLEIKKQAEPHLKQATELYAKVVELDPNSAVAWMGIGSTLNLCEEKEAAQAAFGKSFALNEQILAKSPDDKPSLLRKYSLLVMTHRIEQAKAFAKEKSKLVPEFTNVTKSTR